MHSRIVARRSPWPGRCRWLLDAVACWSRFDTLGGLLTLKGHEEVAHGRDARLAWTRIRGSLTPREWGRVGGMVGFIIGLYVVGWGVFIVAILPEHSKFLGIGVAVTAYTLGLRHAFDADHISAIDNTTRKLMSEGKRPLSVGFWFSLGHSSVVFALGIGLTFAARAIIGQVSNSNSTVATFGGIIGTAVSGTFLYLIADRSTW